LGHLIGAPANGVERLSSQHTHRQSRSESITGAHGVLNQDNFALILDKLAFAVEQASLRASRQAYQMLAMLLRQVFDLLTHAAAQAEQFRQNKQFAIVEFHNIRHAQ
jgi:hypothetical protein